MGWWRMGYLMGVVVGLRNGVGVVGLRNGGWWWGYVMGMGLPNGDEGGAT